MTQEIPQSRAHLHTFDLTGDPVEEYGSSDFELLSNPLSEIEVKRKSIGIWSDKFLKSLKLLNEWKEEKKENA